MRSRIDRNAHRLGQSLLLGLALIGAADPNASGTQGTGLSCINDEDSLREAIRSARSGDTIAVSAETITLTGGELVIDKDLTISGQGPDKTTISGGARTRVFFVCPGVAGATEGPPAACPRVHFSNLTIADGKAQGGRGGDSGSAGAGNGLGGAGGGAAGMGGALFINGGHVTVDSVTFSANQALGGSGGDSAASGTPGA
ncbi:MAG: hypothetical protein HY650_09395, partial [Acidobacteria bacterium]|nr:hypothetical protein [Acidobacteriota bacterium]